MNDQLTSEDREKFELDREQFALKLKGLKKDELVDIAAMLHAKSEWQLAQIEKFKEVQQRFLEQSGRIIESQRQLAATVTKMTPEIENYAKRKARLETRKGKSVAAAKGHAQGMYGKAKAAIQDKWDEWQSNPGRYDGAAEFARKMQQAHPVITDVTTIQRWCTAWKKQQK